MDNQYNQRDHARDSRSPTIRQTPSMSVPIKSTEAATDAMQIWTLLRNFKRFIHSQRRIENEKLVDLKKTLDITRATEDLYLQELEQKLLDIQGERLHPTPARIFLDNATASDTQGDPTDAYIDIDDVPFSRRESTAQFSENFRTLFMRGDIEDATPRPEPEPEPELSAIYIDEPVQIVESSGSLPSPVTPRISRRRSSSLLNDGRPIDLQSQDQTSNLPVIEDAGDQRDMYTNPSSPRVRQGQSSSKVAKSPIRPRQDLRSSSGKRKLRAHEAGTTMAPPPLPVKHDTIAIAESSNNNTSSPQARNGDLDESPANRFREHPPRRCAEFATKRVKLTLEQTRRLGKGSGVWREGSEAPWKTCGSTCKCKLCEEKKAVMKYSRSNHW